MEHDEYTFLCGYQRIRRYGSTSDLNSPSLSSNINRYSRIIVHRVEPTDTLQSLELKYNSSMYEIKRLNRLWSNGSLHCKTHVNVPIFGDSPGSPLPPPNSNDKTSPENSTVAADLNFRRLAMAENRNIRACSLEKVDETDESLDQLFKRIDRDVKKSHKVVKKLIQRGTAPRDENGL